MGWKDKYGLPTQMAMEAIGVKNWKTYKKGFDDLVKWKFLKVIQQSKNQYSATVIALVKNTKPNTKALTKAMQKHSQKQVKSIVDIDIQLIQLIPNTSDEYRKILIDWLEYKVGRGEKYKSDKAIIALSDRLQKFSEGDVGKARDIINQSMSNNWAGLFELKTEKTKSYAKSELPARATGCSFQNPDS